MAGDGGREVSMGSGGVWERSEGRVWEVVGEQEQRLPGRRNCSSTSRAEGPVDPDLSIHCYLNNFAPEEAAVDPSHSLVYHGDGSMIARIEGPIEAAQPRRIKKKKKRRGAAPEESAAEGATPGAAATEEAAEMLESEEPQPSTSGSSAAPEQRSKRDKRRWAGKGWWKRKREQWKRKRKSSAGEGGGGKQLPCSVESSPGRGSPSPTSLRRLLERGTWSPEYVAPSPPSPS